MGCLIYSGFYSAIASSTLILFSILFALYTYLRQQHDSADGKLEDELKNLTKLINKFMDINYDARDIPPHPNLDLDLKDLIHTVIEHYNSCRRTNWEDKEDYKRFLQALKSLQCKVYLNILFNLEAVENIKFEDDSSYVIQSKRVFERFMDRVYPYLVSAEDDVLTCLGGLGSIGDHRQHHKEHWGNVYINDEIKKQAHEFYFSYWDTLLEIKSESKDIDRIIRDFEKRNMLIPILESPQSKRLIKLSAFLIFIFGFIIPLYMLQPNQLGWLQCEVIFYSVIFFILLSIICIFISFRKMSTYGMKTLYRTIWNLKNHKYEFKRREAAKFLGSTGDRIAVRPLEDAIEHDKSEIVRLTAMGALIELGKTERSTVKMGWFAETLDYLLEKIEHLIGKTKGLLGITQYFDQITKDLSNKDSKIRSTALGVLGDIGDPKAVSSIKLLLEIEQNQTVRLSAISALGRIGDSEAARSILEIAADDSEPELVRNHANFILEAYGFRSP